MSSCMCSKRDICTQKETCILVKRPIKESETGKQSPQKRHIYSKSDEYTRKQTCILEKRHVYLKRKISKSLRYVNRGKALKICDMYTRPAKET